MENDKNEVIVYADKMSTPEPMALGDIRKNTALVKQLVREVLVTDVDFGVIPGCGDKPSLFKPGAEKIMLLFKLGCFPDKIEDHSTHDCIKYVVKTRVVHIPTGVELGIGVGSASTDEDKYKWRSAVCDEEFDSLPEEQKRLKWKTKWITKDGRREKEGYSIKQVRTNPADMNNTILKMAAKRSKIDAVITCTAASDLLTQDLEEEAVAGQRAEDPNPIQKPKAKAAPAKKSTGGKAKGVDPATVPAESWKPMQSKYASTCRHCGGQIAVGDSIMYCSQAGAIHSECLDEIHAEKNLDENPETEQEQF